MVNDNLIGGVGSKLAELVSQIAVLVKVKKSISVRAKDRGAWMSITKFAVTTGNGG